MNSTGIFFISIFAGSRGLSSTDLITIKEKISSIFANSADYPTISQNLTLQIVDNQLQVHWDTKAALTNLTIFQKNNGSITNK
jgi:hypothetical protein